MSETTTSFADEMKAAKANNTFVKAEIFDNVNAEVAKPLTAADGLPTGNETVGDVAKSASQVKVKIGTREFTSTEEAMEYAQALELARMQEESFVAGVKSTKQDEPTTPVKELEEEVEEMLFENPKEALKKLRAGIRKELQDAYEADLMARQTAQEQAQKQKAFWEGFSNNNRDLANHTELVQYTYQKNADVLEKEYKKDPEAATKKLADMTRTLLKSYREEATPSKTLQNAPSNVIPGSHINTAPVAQKANDEPIIDFIAQVNKHRKRS